MSDHTEPTAGVPTNAADAGHEIARHVDAVGARIRRRLRRDAEVDELAQQTLARALVSAGAIRNLAAVRPWLLTIAECVVADHLRALGRRVRIATLPIPDEHPDTAAPPTDRTLEYLEFWNIVGRTFDRMPEDLREVGRRHFLVGDSLASIAEALGRKKSTIQSQVQRVREALAARLQQTGYAAMLPLLDVTRDVGVRAAVGGLGSWASRHAGACLAGVAALFAVISAWTAMMVWGAAPVAGGATESRAGSTDRSASLLGSGQPTARAATVARTPANLDMDVLIHGRLVDAATGAPVVGAVVNAFDFLLERVTRVRTGTDGTFVIEESRGVRHPFEVYVSPPPDQDYGRVQLDTLLASRSPLEVRMHPTVSVRLTVMPYEGLIEPQDVEVVVVDLAGSWGPSPGVEWPSPEGLGVRQILPPEFSIVMRRKVAGLVRDVLLEGLPKTYLGFLLVRGDGQAWFGAAPGARLDRAPNVPTRQRTTAEAGTTTEGCEVRITLRDGPSVDLVQIWPRVRQRHVPRSGDFVSLVAEPDSIDYLAMLSEASFDAAAGRAKRVFQSNSPMPESARARLDMGSIPGLTESNDSACYPILIRRVGGLRTLVGYEVGRSRDVLQFDDLPVGEPLVIEVLDSAFGRILYQQSCVVPADRGAVVDLLESVRAVRVLAVAGDEPWEGVEVGITPRSKAQYPSWRDVHRTDAHGEALLHLRDVHAYDVLVQADANEGSTVAAELDQRLGVAEPSHTFDFAQGFRLRVHDGQGWLAPSDNCKVHVEGEVDAGRRVHFRHEVDAGEDGVFTVRTGLAGIVRGRVVILDKTALPADSAWSEVPQCIPFQAIAQGVRSPLRVVELQLPVGSVTGGKGATRELSLSCLTPEGERLRLRAESTTVEARAVGMSGLPSSLTFDNPPRWRELAWRRRADGAATIDVPSWIAECELRVLVGDYAPASVRVDAAYISASADVDLRLRAGSGAVLGDATDRGKPIGVGLAAGDVVERIGERAISCQREMTAALAAADPSLPLTVTVRRGTATMDITLPVGWRELLTRTHYATW